MSSYSNPHIPKSELDSLKETMTERAFAQEILADFLEDGGGVFRHVKDAAILQSQEAEAGHQYVIGVDWGRSNDATVFSVLDTDMRQVALDRMTDTDYASQRMRLSTLAKKYNSAVIMAEANSIGQPNIEALQNMGLSVQGFTTTNATKAKIIQGLELALERGDIRLLDNEQQTNELMAYESEKLPSGLIRYGAPEGMHDDTVMALAIGLYGISRSNVEILENFIYED
jgi:phage FluMu gp28-like protein